jgi:hypothetical protein
MAFQTALTIKEAIASIHSKKYLLPSIQREFVWGVDQITQLFDSLMLGYPIGSFLFWEVGKQNGNEFVFYEFLRNYHERHWYSPHSYCNSFFSFSIIRASRASKNSGKFVNERSMSEGIK